MHDFRLSNTRKLGAALGKAPYEVLERLAGFLGAPPQVLGVSGVHVRAQEVSQECADYVIPVVDLASRRMFEPRPG
jgi:hypothetical protein